MTKKGRMVYVPHSILDEADVIMNMKGHKKRVNAFDDLAKYAKVGIEAERIYKLDFNLFRRKKK